nr:uncharacterized protein LOC118877175 isoform X1 [Drosophila suzukii]
MGQLINPPVGKESSKSQSVDRDVGGDSGSLGRRQRSSITQKNDTLFTAKAHPLLVGTPATPPRPSSSTYYVHQVLRSKNDGKIRKSDSQKRREKGTRRETEATAAMAH